MGGGMMNMPRASYRKGGGVCIKGMNKDAVRKEFVMRTYYSKGGGLTCMGKDKTGSILQTSGQMAHTRSVEEVVAKKEKIIQNACPLQKQER